MRRLICTWEDAHADASDWTAADALAKQPRLIQTIGFEVDGGPADCLTLAQMWDPSEAAFSHVMHIPHGMVRTLHEFGPGEPAASL